jgi:hypothetical protein
VTPREAANIRAMARRAGMTESAFLRRVAEVYSRAEAERIEAADLTAQRRTVELLTAEDATRKVA